LFVRQKLGSNFVTMPSALVGSLLAPIIVFLSIIFHVLKVYVSFARN